MHWRIKNDATGQCRPARAGPRDPRVGHARCRSATSAEAKIVIPSAARDLPTVKVPRPAASRFAYRSKLATEPHDPLRRPCGRRPRVSALRGAGTLTAIVGPERRGQDDLLQPDLRAAAGERPARDCSNGTRPHGRSRRAAPHAGGLGRAFQLTNLFPDLSVHENVRLAVQARESPQGGRATTCCARLERPSRLDRPGR